MPHPDLVKYGLASGAALLALVTAAPAAACSDLPNICAAQAQHHQQMIDIAATSPQGEEDPRYEEPPADPMRDRMTVATGMVALMQESVNNMVKRAELMKNPLYTRYENGGWDFFQDHAEPAPGEYCAAFYWKKDGFVRLSGPGGDYDGALLTFWSDDIPRPDTVRKLQVTLTQSDGSPPQTVEALNYHLAGDAYGAIALTVPSVDALLDNMLDSHGFDVSIKGKSVAKVDWTGGLAARDRLKKCVAKRARK
ncbi:MULTISPECIES: hypothetical protein [unclassified Sphingopyxis]|uniref:hypothetical protein n=1 Tax=unclassified Sphingopyxis TaxID=2614943 RepID=UPI0007369BCD|nr:MULTISPECIES: hypothetical protein [unclassified Sphingopyxis]KTE38407.1 hypothetical protein ATE62_11365 [Sphingopyxis sp. HIX]KTE84193.1 hypothetical protein ATE72_10290 [Sphingopyxis sp. HXXIV]